MRERKRRQIRERREAQRRKHGKEGGFWSPPKIWQDGTAFIIGGGPSVNKTDLSLIHDRRVIAVNNAYGDPVHSASGRLIRYVPRLWVDVVFYGDCGWLPIHREWLREFPGLRVTCCIRHQGQEPWVKCMERRNHPQGIITSPGMIAWNLSSGGAAVNLAVHLGVRRIVLIGYDMRKVDGEKNWHRDHKNQNPRQDPFVRFLRPFPEIARDLTRLGIECLNATPESALTVFPIVTLEEALC